jgi:2-polyprenyl-3-methyl-5-hydroxy-6-metoxy-1,4-benzoquinol methylase
MRACLRDLAKVNVLTLAHRPTLEWMSRVTQMHRGEGPLHVVDVGCGGGDLLRKLERWARRQEIKLRLTGIDLNPQCIRIAQEFSPDDCGVEWIAGDAFSYKPDGGIDVVLSSLMTHHLSDTEVIAFVAWMEATARCGWFVNDLYRSEGAYKLFACLAKLMRWHRFVQHDGPVSIRRSFREEDWKRLVMRAGIAPEVVEIAKAFPSRLCVGRMR